LGEIDRLPVESGLSDLSRDAAPAVDEFKAVTILRLKMEELKANPLLKRDSEAAIRDGSRFQGWVRVIRRHVWVAAFLVAITLVAPAVYAGPWSQLPDAIDRLVSRPGDEDAERIVVLAETSILREAQAGRLVPTRMLFDTYASLISSLPNGTFRLRTVERRLAERLFANGERLRSTDFPQAAASWALAAEYDPDSESIDRLRSVLYPPVQAEPGQVWVAPLDGAPLVFHPAATIRLGCTENDGACRDNELLFRWIEVPARWYESREVSNRRYRKCVEAGACTQPEDPTAYDEVRRRDHPVVGVSWRQARAFARWAGRRLPSEAEWERAARGEITSIRFPWGNDRRRELANVWVGPRSGVDGGTKTVGRYPTLGYGMKDMPGNVWEWCEDRYQPLHSPASNGGGAAREGLGRVVRGGSWRRAIDMARVSTREWYDIEYYADDLGFRCVVDHDPPIDLNRLIRTAQRAFPAVVETGHELSGAELEAEDRRYLERRALTLYVIEDRTEDALIPAARRLAAESGDPVARDIFVRFETELLRKASGEEIAEVQRGLVAYQAAVEEAPQLGGRFASFQRQLVLMLRQAVVDYEERGASKAARTAAELGLELDRKDAIFTAAISRLTRRTGVSKVWPGDGKGMVWVGSQSYQMGSPPADNAANSSEQPPHRVTVEGFWMDRTEVNNDEYRQCVRARDCSVPSRAEFFNDPNLGNHPVMWVTWIQAREYAAWAGKRLPTEAEWELAARGGTTTPYPWGASWVPGRANAIGTYREDRWGGTAPVASFGPNPWGLYDVIGNAAEWVEDVYNDSYYGAPRDGRAWYQETGLASERRRVARGGGYDDPPQRQRVSKRSGRQLDNYNRAVGFRCAANE
jgi:formylglycine-generating enzyme required for sulfatase activity